MARVRPRAPGAGCHATRLHARGLAHEGEGPYPRRNPWEHVGFLGLDTTLLRQFKGVCEQTRHEARDDTVSWGTYLLLVQRFGGVDERPDEALMPPSCKGCGGPLFTLSGRRRTHCDNACKQRAYRRRKDASRTTSG